jgi:hypothetical protein
MRKDFDVAAVGDLNADLILSGDVTPVFGQVEKLIDDATLTMGGSTAIFACGAARLGLRVAFVGKVGATRSATFCSTHWRRTALTLPACAATHSIKSGLTTVLSRGVDRAMLTYSGNTGRTRPRRHRLVDRGAGATSAPGQLLYARRAAPGYPATLCRSARTRPHRLARHQLRPDRAVGGASTLRWRMWTSFCPTKPRPRRLVVARRGRRGWRTWPHACRSSRSNAGAMARLSSAAITRRGAAHSCRPSSTPPVRVIPLTLALSTAIWQAGRWRARWPLPPRAALPRRVWLAASKRNPRSTSRWRWLQNNQPNVDDVEQTEIRGCEAPA